MDKEGCQEERVGHWGSMCGVPVELAVVLHRTSLSSLNIC